MSTVMTSSLGRELRRRLWADIGAIEVFVESERCSTSPDAAKKQATLKKTATDLWDALANAQAL